MHIESSSGKTRCQPTRCLYFFNISRFLSDSAQPSWKTADELHKAEALDDASGIAPGSLNMSTPQQTRNDDQRRTQAAGGTAEDKRHFKTIANLEINVLRQLLCECSLLSNIMKQFAHPSQQSRMIGLTDMKT